MPYDHDQRQADREAARAALRLIVADGGEPADIRLETAKALFALSDDP